jgi:hypothetical protein
VQRSVRRSLMLAAVVAGLTSALSCYLVPLHAQAPPRGAPDVRTHRQIPFRNLIDVQFLAGVPEGGASFTPSLRVALQRRAGLGWSWSAAGLFLQDALSSTQGLAVGGSLALPVGGILLEPFVEVGGGVTDARISSGFYDVFTPGGGVETIERFRAVDGFATLAGAGVGTSWISGSGLLTRLGLGYWRVQGSDGLARGSVRAALSVGLARRDETWYRRATDRTPPLAVVVGAGEEVSDSVRVTDGVVVVLASDENGIRRVIANGDQAELSEPEPGSAALLGTGNTVAATVPVPETPFEGAPVGIVVEDRGRQVTRLDLRAFGEPDLSPPELSSAESLGEVTDAGWHLRAVATDFAGIADASVGFCPLEVFRPLGLEPSALQLGAADRVVAGWGLFPRDAVVRVRDRAGNVADLSLEPRYDSRPLGNAPPTILEADVQTGAGRAPGLVSVHVQGRAVDPGSGWISSVTVNGRPAFIRPSPAGPSSVAFNGWVPVDADTETVSVVVETADGRRESAELPVQPAPVSTEARRILLVAGEGAADEFAVPMTAVTAAFEREGAPLEVRRASSRQEVLQFLREIRVEPATVVWAHVVGELSGLRSEPGPRLSMDDGRSVTVQFLEDEFRRLEVGATLVSAGWRPGRTWRLLPLKMPGADARPGCFSSQAGNWGTVMPLGTHDADRMGAAISGDADLDGDGVVRAGELSDFLSGVPSPGVYAGDPLLPVLLIPGFEGGGR